MSSDDRQLAELARRLGATLMAHGQRIVTVESCSGGYLAKLLTDVPGSSQWFDCGYVTYSNTAKQRDLGVAAQDLLLHGAVSEVVVRAMAEGALTRTAADVAVSLSGVAGPEGGTPRNPVGSVWLGLATRGDDGVRAEAQHRQFGGDRDEVRREAVAAAMQWMLLRLTQTRRD